MGLEKIIKFASNAFKASVLAGALALNFGCSKEESIVPNTPPANNPPVIKTIPDQKVTEGYSIKLNLNDYISDEDGDPLIVTKTSNILYYGSIINNEYEYEHKKDNDFIDHTYQIYFSVSDGKETAQGSFYLLAIDNHPPVIDTIPYQTAREGQQFALNLNDYISDVEGEVLCASPASWSPDPAGTIVDNWFYYTPQDNDALDKEKIITFLLSDGVNTVSGSFKVLELDSGITTSTETVSSGLEAIVLDPAFSEETSIAVNSQNQVHIAYRNRDDPSYNDYCQTLLANIDGRWLRTHPGARYTGRWNSIAIDGQDKIHISHSARDRDGEDLRYCRLDNINANAYQNNIYVDLGGSVGLFNNIYLDNNGKAHITYYDWCSRITKYATNASGEWVASNNCNGLSIHYKDSLAIDCNNKFHFAKTGNALIYANDTTGSWQSQTIDSSVCNAASIKMDGNGSLHIAYQSNPYTGSKKQMYASNSSGSWQTSSIDEQVNYLYENPAIALSGNSAGILYIERRQNFTDELFSGVLKFACNGTGTWRVYTLDNRDTCSANSLSVDSNGRFHASYVENTELKYLSFTESELGQ